ncbi:hypothetical protein D9M71_443550 [compost metagenome]
MQEDPQRAVETRQFVHHQALVQGRQALQLAVQPAAYPWLAAHDKQQHHQQHETAAHGHLMGVQEHPGLHQPARHPRQFGAQAFEHQAEARYHIPQQKQHHATTDQQQQQRVDRGADDLLAHFVHALAVGDIAAEGIAQGAGLLARLHQGHVQRREHAGQLRQGLGQRLAFVQQAHQLTEGLARLGRGLFLGQALEGVNQRQAGVDQGGQLLAEQHQVEHLATPPAQAGQALATAHADHPQALLLDLLAGEACVLGVDLQQDHAGLAQCLEFVAHVQPLPTIANW